MTFCFRSHEVALTEGLLEGYKVHVTKKVKPEPSQMKGTVTARTEYTACLLHGQAKKFTIFLDITTNWRLLIPYVSYESSKSPKMKIKEE